MAGLTPGQLDFGLVKHFTADELRPLVDMVRRLCADNDPEPPTHLCADNDPEPHKLTLRNLTRS